MNVCERRVRREKELCRKSEWKKMEQRKGEDGEWLYMYIEHAKNVNPDQTTSNIVNSSLDKMDERVIYF